MSAQAPKPVDLGGAAYYPGLMSTAQQTACVEALRTVVRAAPFFTPVTPWGKPMSVRMTAAGRYGWVSDRAGYRYERKHPSGTPWPPIPEEIRDVWEAVSGVDRAPECCLVNYYGTGARMGLHQDRDEADFQWPVVSISLGDSALFRIRGTARRDPTRSVWLTSGDVIVLTGPSRLAYHGIDRVKPGSSTLLSGGGRLNLTLRVVED